MVKSVSSIQTTPVIHPDLPTDNTVEFLPKAPLDVFRFFQVDLGSDTTDDVNTVVSIYEMLDGKSVGDKMLYLRQVNEYLGYPQSNEKQLYRVQAWLQHKRAIGELVKRQQALERGM